MMTMMIKAHGNPRPSTCFMLNGRALSINDLPQSIRIRNFDDNTCALEIESLNASLCGSYTAVATNVYGAVHSTALVELIDNGMDIVCFFNDFFSRNN